MIENEFILSLKINPNVCSPLPHIWLFSGVLEVKLKFQDKFYYIFDHTKCPSSGELDQKCVLRKSYLHQIQPRHKA